MRHGTSNRRQRGRGGNGNRGGGNERTQVFDSNGPDVRIRGNARQVVEKYLTLAKDAVASDDVVLAESYFQHAEHYQRVVNGWDYELQNGHPPVQRESNQPSRERTKREEGRESKKDDLSLPASILGAKAEVKSQGNVAETV